MDETGTFERKQVCFSTYIWPMSENRDANQTLRKNLGGIDRQTDGQVGRTDCLYPACTCAMQGKKRIQLHAYQ